jgi:transcriptional regulator with XRE-family HTH domain
MADASIGRRIREARVRRGLTLTDVAAKVGVTPSALSQLERGRFNPTLATLKAIGSALHLTIGNLFAPGRGMDGAVVRRDRQKRLSPRKGITYRLLTPDLTGPVEFILAVYDVGASTGEEPFAYPAEQCGVVLEGVAAVHLGETVHRLRAGDSIRFDCAVPHRIVNAGRSKLRCIWAISPPTF